MRELRAITVTWKLLMLAAAELASQQPQLSAVGRGPRVGLQENCTTICGDVVLPYPFGITTGCYLPGGY